ncbi:hypothetical protein BRARA_I04437 [Brassica rapa]|uniref:Secreted protein n=2 Tax=Brassica TaxID=3705 RepID=A0A397Y2P4_BRACM|nr:hypothetical protein BRARA_I04437 [Brassica rapa]CAF2049416.1 unnamed protein product [Brassica napus]CAG7866368.1 unnamed protein product [Brassica rapa]VDC63369.1 unnamed protein product [Brassica rapa]
MWRIIMIFYLLALVGRGNSGRTPIWRKDLGRLHGLQNQLQRGLVPPSQPSLCHNRVNTLSHQDAYSSQSYVLCP